MRQNARVAIVVFVKNQILSHLNQQTLLLGLRKEELQREEKKLKYARNAVVQLVMTILNLHAGNAITLSVKTVDISTWTNLQK
jgi:hypothetical protein